MKMQALTTKIQQTIFFATALILGLLLAGCQTADSAPTIPPTPIGAGVTQPTIVAVSTPTLASSGGAVVEPEVMVETTAVVAETAVPTPNPLLQTSRSIGDPYTPELGNQGYDVQNYTLKLALDPANPFVQGETTIDAIATEADLAEISLDFIGFSDVSVTSGGDTLSYFRDGDKLIVDLPRPLATGTPFGLTIRYAGEPTRRNSPYVGFVEALGLTFANEMVYALAEPDGARYWFPSNDHPRDKAFFRFEVTVPQGLTAVANGQLISEQPTDSSTVFVWEHNHLMAPYLAIVAVGNFERIDAVSPKGIPLRHYVTAAAREDFVRVEGVTGDAVDWLSQLLGPYPFEAMGFVTIDAPTVALETQTMSVLSYDLVGARTAVHEIVHMWFGNHVSLHSWQEMWRNEGFATYFAIMWELDDQPAAMDQRMLEVAGAVEQNTPQYALGNPPPSQLFGFNTYFKGATAVHALRREIGDDAFFAGLRLYFERFGGGTASDADFQVVMEEVSGESLEAFFAEWLS